MTSPPPPAEPQAPAPRDSGPISAHDLHLESVSVRFAGAETDALHRVDLRVGPGEIWAVLGPSGSGKSTLLRVIAGIEAPTAGRLLSGGRDLAEVPPHRRGMALMFQEGQLFDHLDVADNVAFGLRVGPRASRPTPAQRTRRVREALQLVGLGDFGPREVAGLSGGEQQRVALARALVIGPKVMLLDEPFSSLDSHLREQLADSTRELLHRAGTTSVLVTHDHWEAFAMADHVAVLSAGRLVRAGALDEVWADPQNLPAAQVLGYDILTAEQSSVLAGWAASLDTYDGSAGDFSRDSHLAVRGAPLRLCEAATPGASEATLLAFRPGPREGLYRVQTHDGHQWWASAAESSAGSESADVVRSWVVVCPERLATLT